MNKPNVLLLMCDQFRGDCLSFLDHPDVKTPYLDTLASDGVTFKNAYTATPSCIPARACLLTGMSQEKNGRVGYEEGLTFDYDHYLADYAGKTVSTIYDFQLADFQSEQHDVAIQEVFVE